MLYRFPKESLHNYRVTLDSSELCDYTDMLVSYILKDAIEGKTGYSHVFTESEVFVDRVVANLRKVFCDSVILHYKKRALDESLMENGIIMDWA